MVSKLTMAGLGAMVLSTVLIIVMYSMIPVIGDQIDTASTIRTNAAATGTLTFTGGANASNTVNISTETYTFTNGTAGQYNVDIGADTGANASYSTSQLVAEITANSSLVTAVDNGDNTTTLTSVITGTTGNSYATTENLTDASFGAAVMSGGIDGSQWDSDTNTNLPTGVVFWATIAPFVLLVSMILFVAMVLGILTVKAGRRL